jgi:hypothetical protein
VLLPDELNAKVMVGEAGVYLNVDGEIWDLQGPSPIRPEGVEGLEEAM